MELKGPIWEALLEKLLSEKVVWFTTVDARGAPQPRLVWFVWDGEEVTIYSQPNTGKIRHIRANPNVALHFNSDAAGSDFQVINGTASLDETAPLVIDLPIYLDKYHADIYGIEMTEESFSQAFSTPIRVKPVRIRGL